MSNPLIEQLAETKLPLHELKLQYIYAVIKSFGGNRSRAAKALKINLSALYKIVKLYEWTEFYGRNKPRTPKVKP